MSTYLSGNPTYLPQIQPFKPNLNLYAGVLQMKQTKFDTAHKQLSSLYGSLLNSKMLREDTNAAREEYFKNIQDEIKKIANVDLSLTQNVDAASSIFDNLADNDAIVKDMSFTKSYMNELKRADALRTITDPEKGGGQYWEEGVQALDMKAQEFANSDLDSAMGMSAPKYTSYVDVMGKAMKLAKESGFNIKVDTVTNEWIVTEKNGERLAPHLMTLFQQQLGNDPMVKDMYKTKAYVGRKNWIASNVEQYGSEEAATEAYVKKVNNAYYTKMGKTKEDIELQNKYLEERLNNITKNSEPWELKQGNSSFEESNKQALALAANKETIQYIETEISNHDNVNRLQSLKGIAESMDGTYASLMMFDDLSEAANTYAQATYERTVNVNQWGLERQKHAWAKELKQIQFENDKELAKIKAALKGETASKKDGSLAGALNLEPTGSDATTPENIEEGATAKAINEAEAQLWKEASGSRKNILQTIAGLAETDESNLETVRRVNLRIAYEKLNQLKNKKDDVSIKRTNQLVEDIKYYKTMSKPDNTFYDRYGSTLDAKTTKEVYDKLQPLMINFLKDNQKTIDKGITYNLLSSMKLIEDKSRYHKDLIKAEANIKRSALVKLAETTEDPELQALLIDKENEPYLLDKMGNFKNPFQSATELALKEVFKEDIFYDSRLQGYRVGEKIFYSTGYGDTPKEAKAKAEAYRKEKFLKSGVLIKDSDGKEQRLRYVDIVDGEGNLKSKYKNSDIKLLDGYLNSKQSVYLSSLSKLGSGISASDIIKTSKKLNINKNQAKNLVATQSINDELYKAMDRVKVNGKPTVNYIEGLIGIGDKVGKGFAFNLSSDMADPKHEGFDIFTGVKEYITDVNRNINSDNVQFVLNNEVLQKNARSIYNDLISYKKLNEIRFDYKSNPKNTKDIQALMMDIPESILKKYLTTEELNAEKGKKLRLTVSLADKVATNSLHNSTKLEPADLLHRLNNNETKIDSKYKDFFNGSIFSHNGGYIVRGTLYDIDENGNRVGRPYQQEFSDANSASTVKLSFEEFLNDYANF